MKLSHVAKSSLIIAVFFGLDKGLGLVRAVLFNRQFAAGERDMFFVSNNIPDLLSALISGGALGIALIPVLAETIEQEGRPAAWALFTRIANLAFIATGLIAAVIMLLAEPLVEHLIAPGFNDPARWSTTASMMRLDLLAILIFSISGLVMAGLQANQHFLFPAMAPAFYNIGQIVGITILGPRFGIYGMVYGVILGALLHLGIQLPGLLMQRFRWAPVLDLTSPRVRQVLRVLGPRVLNMFFLQTYFLSRDRFASFFEEGAISALNNGWFIQQVPETLIGTAIAIALLPTLSEQLARSEGDSFRQTVNQALRVLLALTLPVAAVLAVTIRPLVQVVFDFSPQETELLVWASRFFLLGLMGHTWLEVAVRSFYAQQDARTPLIASALQAGSFIIIAILLSNIMSSTGIALADTLTFSTQALVLLWILNRRYRGVLAVGKTFARGIVGALLAGLLAYGLMRVLPLPPLFTALAALAGGGLVALPFMWPELGLLLRLGSATRDM